MLSNLLAAFGMTGAVVASAMLAVFEAETNPAANLTGDWSIVSGERDGQKIPDADLKGKVVRFTADRVVYAVNAKEDFAASFRLDTEKSPWVITMTGRDKNGGEVKSTGLVNREGDTLTVVYALPGGDAPSEFATKKAQQMFVLKRNK